MKILYITTFKTNNSIASSGTVNAVKNALELAGNEVIVIDDLKRPILWKIIEKIIRKITKKNFDIVREPSVLKKFDKEIQKKSSQIDYDICFHNLVFFVHIIVEKSLLSFILTQR